MRRREGWNAWVFDFNNPKESRTGSEGEVLKEFSRKGMSRGAIGFFFMGGERKRDPLYVDDISIEYLRT